MAFIPGTGDTGTGYLGDLRAEVTNQQIPYGPYAVADALGDGDPGLAAVKYLPASPDFAWAVFSALAGDGSGGSGTWAAASPGTSTYQSDNAFGDQTDSGCPHPSGGLVVLTTKRTGLPGSQAHRLARWTAGAGPVAVAGPFTVANVVATGQWWMVRRSDDSYVILDGSGGEVVGGVTRTRARLHVVDAAHTTLTTYAVTGDTDTSALAANQTPVGLYVSPDTDRVWVLWRVGSASLLWRTFDSSDTFGAYDTTGVATRSIGTMVPVGRGCVATRSGATVLAVPVNTASTEIKVHYLADDAVTTAPVATETITTGVSVGADVTTFGTLMTLATTSTARSVDALVLLYATPTNSTPGTPSRLRILQRTGAGWGAEATWKTAHTSGPTSYTFTTARSAWIPGALNAGVVWQEFFNSTTSLSRFDYALTAPAPTHRAYAVAQVI